MGAGAASWSAAPTRPLNPAVATTALSHNAANTAVTPAVTATCTGTLQVTDTDNNTPIGFVSNVWNQFGEYVVTTTPSQYLSVSFPASSQIAITATNPQSGAFPLVGLIQGADSTSPDLAAGSSNYAYLGGTTATAPGATPASGDNSFTSSVGFPEDIESSVWSLGPSSNVVPQWINTDGSDAPTYLLDYMGYLVVTGDPLAFMDFFGTGTNVALTVVPSCSVPITGTTTTVTITPTSPKVNQAVTITAKVKPAPATSSVTQP